MEIKPTYVTFEQAKLLKEKGFKSDTNCYYFKDGKFCQFSIKDTYGYYGEEYTVELIELYRNWNDGWLQNKYGNRCFGCSEKDGYFQTYSAPEQWMVVEWIRLNYGIWIYPYCAGNNKFHYGIANSMTGSIITNSYRRNGNKLESLFAGYSSPQEAISAAFDYIKEKGLI